MSSKQTSVDPKAKEIPEIILNASTGARYERGKFLGKGGFAKCFELTDMTTGAVTAGKIVPKALLLRQNQREKMTQEIRLHKALEHKFVVKLYSYFEDTNFVYIILELCRRRSLMELHRRRRAITEPETRYFMNQILLGCQYLHSDRIIHRDLKLGNIFLNDNMEIKLGDFGLATRVDYDGERKRTLCGTPNYIAPEVLTKKGHSYEVDIWSLGCIMYTLLVGKPPFETQTLKDTYHRIKKNEYHIPSRIGPLAKKLIHKLLQHEPDKRPTIGEILEDDFMTMGYLPSRLPVSCLTTAPRFDTKNDQSLIARRGPLMEINHHVPISNVAESKKDSGDVQPKDCFLRELNSQLTKLMLSQPKSKYPVNDEEAEDPKVVPMVWISKWVDYSDKYGFGYSLCDESIGVVFNDLTKLLLLRDEINIHYIDAEEEEYYHTIKKFPSHLDKKLKLLKYFRSYMKEHLLKTGADMEIREGDELSRIPCLKTWFRTSRAVIMHLTNGTVQINFFKCHSKIILCPHMCAVTYIDESRRSVTYSFELITKHGCSEELFSRLSYAHEKIRMLIDKSGPGNSQPPVHPN